jgi:hypothetical protein
MSEVFLELVLAERSGSSDVVSDRQDLEDALAEAFDGIAEVTGGGADMGTSNIDIEVGNEESVADVVNVARRICQEYGWATGGRVIRRHPPATGVASLGAK